MEFNINEYVKVKLTDYGRKVHKEDHDAFWNEVVIKNRPAYKAPIEDENGWSKWQLWALMEAFGCHTGLGIEPCFETTIEINCPHPSQDKSDQRIAP
jgi:hypothetical protein